MVLAAGSAAGAWLNKCLLKRSVAGERLTAFAAVLMLPAGIALHILQDSLQLLAPMLLVVLAVGIAIPNVLGLALASYRDQLGTAGALFGLAYYLMIGVGMLLVGCAQALGATVIVCAGLATAACAAPFNLMKIQRQPDDTAAQPSTHALTRHAPHARRARFWRLFKGDNRWIHPPIRIRPIARKPWALSLNLAGPAAFPASCCGRAASTATEYSRAISISWSTTRASTTY